MAAQEDVANAALVNLGLAPTITDLDADVSLEAQTAKLFLPRARRYTLSRYSWGFAREYIELDEPETQDGSQPWWDQWTYAYPWPDDVVVVRRILTGKGESEVKPPAFKPGRSGGERVLFTKFLDDPATRVEVTIDVPDLDDWIDPPLRCLEWRLAWHLIVPLARNDRKPETIMGNFRSELAAAVEEDALQQQTGEPGPSGWRGSRR